MEIQETVVVFLSSTEAPYRSLSKLTIELVWLHRLYKEVTFHVLSLMKVCTDSQAALQLAKNLVHYIKIMLIYVHLFGLCIILFINC